MVLVDQDMPFVFLAYLQGIETYSRHNLQMSIYLFLAYLQGIETRLRLHAKHIGRPFLAYLQGIETLTTAPHYSLQT